MKGPVARAGVAALALVLPLTLAACKQEGPAERAGKEVDKSVEKAGDAMEKAGDKVKDATN